MEAYKQEFSEIVFGIMGLVRKISEQTEKFFWMAI